MYATAYLCMKLGKEGEKKAGLSQRRYEPFMMTDCDTDAMLYQLSYQAK